MGGPPPPPRPAPVSRAAGRPCPCPASCLRPLCARWTRAVPSHPSSAGRPRVYVLLINGSRVGFSLSACSFKWFCQKKKILTIPGAGGPRNGFVKEHRVRATGTRSRLAANTRCGHDVRYIGFQSRHQTMPGLASSSLEGPAMCCISGHTAAVKLHNQGKS